MDRFLRKESIRPRPRHWRLLRLRRSAEHRDHRRTHREDHEPALHRAGRRLRLGHALAKRLQLSVRQSRRRRRRGRECARRRRHSLLLRKPDDLGHLVPVRVAPGQPNTAEALGAHRRRQLGPSGSGRLEAAGLRQRYRACGQLPFGAPSAPPRVRPRVSGGTHSGIRHRSPRPWWSSRWRCAARNRPD